MLSALDATQNFTASQNGIKADKNPFYADEKWIAFYETHIHPQMLNKTKPIKNKYQDI